MVIMGFERADARLMFNIWRMSLVDRYLGSALGGAWAIVNPLLMFGLFTFVFGYVFKARLPGADSTLGYSIWLISGYGPWLANSEALTSASNSIIGNSGLVKNMSFKTEILPISSVCLGLVPLGVSLVFLLGLLLFNGDGWGWSLILLPLILAVQFIFLATVGVFIAAITTFIRDFGIVLPNLLMIVLFATPIFYPINSVPPIISRLMLLNPFYIISEGYRFALLGNNGPVIMPVILLGVISLVGLKFSLALFRRVKSFFPSLI